MIKRISTQTILMHVASCSLAELELLLQLAVQVQQLRRLDETITEPLERTAPPNSAVARTEQPRAHPATRATSPLGTAARTPMRPPTRNSYRWQVHEFLKAKGVSRRAQIVDHIIKLRGLSREKAEKAVDAVILNRWDPFICLATRGYYRFRPTNEDQSENLLPPAASQA